MKLIILLSSFVFLSISSAYAGSSCKTDWQGRYVCNHDNGYTTTTKRDWQGRDVTNDNRGNTQTCKTDWQGRYVCN